MKRMIKGFVFLMLLILIPLSSAYVHTSSPSNFDNGVYNNTELYNNEYIRLTSGNTNGTYTSEVFESALIDNVNNDFTSYDLISWYGIPHLFGEFPDNKAIVDDINMSGNFFLLHLNEVSGTIYDTSGEGLTGSSYGGVTYGAMGYFNTALSFDGVDDYVDFGNVLGLNETEPFSLAFWIKKNDVSTSSKPIMSKIDVYGNGDGWAINFSQNKILFALYSDISTTNYLQIRSSSNVFIDNAYHLVVITYNGNSSTSGINLFIDGALDTSPTILKDNLTGSIETNADFHLAKKYGYASFGNFTIDEVMFLNRVVSSDRVSDFYNLGEPNLNLDVRSCDDSACSGESWTRLGENTPEIMSLDYNNYFQYKYILNTSNAIYTPKLYNVNITYSAVENWIDIFNPPTSYAQNSSFDFVVDVSFDSMTTGRTYNAYNGLTTTIGKPYNLWSMFDNNYILGSNQGTHWLSDKNILGYGLTGSQCSGLGLEPTDVWVSMSFDNNKTYDVGNFSTWIGGSSQPEGCIVYDVLYCNGYNCPNNELNLSTNDWIYKTTINIGTGTFGQWVTNDLDIENARKIKWVCKKGWTGSSGGKCGEIKIIDWELDVYGIGSYLICDLDSCAFIETFDYDDDILNHGWYGQSMIPINNQLVCNVSALTEQFYYGFNTLTPEHGDVSFEFELNIINQSIPLKVDLGYNQDFGIRLKFIDGVVYDNDRNEPLISYIEGENYNYRLIFNLASQTYTLYQDDIRMDLTTDSFMNFYTTVSNINFVQFVPDLYSAGINCDWVLDNINVNTDVSIDTTFAISNAQKVGGIDFSDGSVGFDESVCRQNENSNLCLVRSVGVDILTTFKNWILGGLILFVVLLIILFAVLMFKHNR